MAQRRRSEQRERSTAWMAQFAEAKECTGIVATAQRCSAFIVEMLLLLPSLPSASLLSPTSAPAIPLIPPPVLSLSLSAEAEAAIHPLPSSAPLFPSPASSFLPPYLPTIQETHTRPTHAHAAPRHAKRSPRSCDPAAPEEAAQQYQVVRTNWTGVALTSRCPVAAAETRPWRGKRCPRTRGRPAAAAAEALAMTVARARMRGGGGRAEAAGITRSSRPTRRSCRCRYTRVATASSRCRCRRPCWSTCTSRRRRRCCSPRCRRATGSPPAPRCLGGRRGDRGSRRRRRTPSPPRCCRYRTVKRYPLITSPPGYYYTGLMACVFICLMPLLVSAVAFLIDVCGVLLLPIALMVF